MRHEYYQAPEMQPDLPRWLDRDRQWHIEYGGYLSNHLSHNWVVMSAAGAPPAQMQWWEDLYTNRLSTEPARSSGDLEPRPPSPPGMEIRAASWQAQLRRPEAFSAYVEFFDGQLRELGRAEVLRRFLPALLPGLAGAALHGIIHLGWAREAAHDGMLADGLAYMATAYQPLGTDARHQPPARLWSAAAAEPLPASLAFLIRSREAGLAQVAEAASQSEAYRALGRGLFQQRLIAFDDPALPLAAALNEAGPLGLPEPGAPLLATVEQLVVLMAAALRGARNEFFVLHGLTSLHAVLCVLPDLDAADQRQALAHWWRAAMATMVAQDFPGLEASAARVAAWQESRRAPALATGTAAQWRRLLRRSLDSHDEHIPKGVFALWRWASFGVFAPATQALLWEAARGLCCGAEQGGLAQALWFAKSYEDSGQQVEVGC